MPTFTALTTLNGQQPADALGEALERLVPEPTGVGVFEVEDGSGIWEVGGYFIEKPDEAGLALLAGLTWAGYSVFSRRLGHAPTASVAVFCIATAIASWGLHLTFEETVWPEDITGWASIAGLGLGPVGLAFYVWDIGVKRGDIQLLGISSYAAPLLSTLILVLAGVAAPSWTLALAAALITGGALIAARASLAVD